MAGATLVAVTTENATSTTVDDDRFEVADGNLKLKDDMSLDFEGDDGGSVDVTITASGDGESATHTVTVTINDLNEAPTIDVRDGEEVPQKGVTSSLTIDEAVMGADLPPLALIEVMDADAADATTGQAGADMVTLSGDMADYFEVKLDPEDGLWLALKADMSLDYETVGDSVMVTVTYTDSAGQSVGVDVTVMVNNVNESPEVDGMVADMSFVGGAENSMEVDLKALFMDPDGDRLTYSLSENAPDWLTLSVTTSGSGDDQTITGTISGTPPAGADATVDDVSIIATDDGGESSEAMFDVIVDAENDAPTRLELRVRDDDLIVRVTEVEVGENEDGAVLGTVVVRDPDDERHPHGQHEFSFMVDDAADDRFEVSDDGKLKLKDDASLNYEDGSTIVLTLTAKDMYVTAPGEDDEDTRESISLEITITVTDGSGGSADGPKANEIGDWWVTMDEDLDADDVLKGDWLSFRLRIDGLDNNPAFSDEDGQTLTFSLGAGAPAWLQIDEKGRFTNKEGMIAEEGGAHEITVIATDPDGNTAEGTFTLAVAVGDPDDSDNDRPDIRDVIEYDYTEGDGGRMVAEFTVRDEDLPIAPHPYGTLKVTIDSATQENRGNVKALFKLVEVEGDPDNDANTTQYQIWTKSAAELSVDAMGKALPAARVPKPLDYEQGDEVDIVVSVVDAPRTAGITGRTDTRTITVDIDDAADEMPVFSNPTGSSRVAKDMTTTFTSDQEESAKEVIVLQLNEVWSDPDSDVDDLRFEVDGTDNLPDWIDVYGPQRWEAIYSRVGDILETHSSARDDDMVVAIVIDRTASGDNESTGKGLGSFTLMARDPDGNEATETISFDVTNLNEDIPSTAKPVTINGDPNGIGTLTMSFDASLDPDLSSADDAALVVYTWSHDNGTPDDATDDQILSVSSTPQPLGLDVGARTGSTARDRVNDYVGAKIKATVEYYEVNPGTGALDESMSYSIETDAVEQEAATPRTSVSYEVTTDASGVSVVITATGDAQSASGVTGNVKLQSSRDGSDGTWQNVDTGDADTSGAGGTATVTLDVDANGDGTTTTGDGGGLYYRVAYSYTVDGNARTDHHEVGQLGSLADPTTTGGSTANILGADAGTPLDSGGSIRVDTGGNDAEVQWQVRASATSPWMDIDGATEVALDVTGAYANKDLRAKVTYTADDNPATTDVNEDGWPVWVEYTEIIDVAGRTNVVPVTSQATHEVRVELGAASMAGQPTKIEMDSVADLFFDSDGDALTYSIDATGTTVLNVDATAAQAGPPAVPAVPGAVSELGAGGSVYRVYETEDVSGTDERTGDVRQSLALDKQTGALTYITDQAQGHDGVTTDGTGNTLTFVISATDNDPGTTTPPTATVTVRINVAPTAINFSDGTTTAADLSTDKMAPTAITVADADGADGETDDPDTPEDETASDPFTVAENVKNQGEVNLGAINVMDQNLNTDGFGTHKVTVSDSDRFEIRADTGGDTDGSTWSLWLKEGATFDYEKDGDKAGTLTLTITATDSGGLKTVGYVTIQISDVEEETVTPTPVTPADPTTPGLKDDTNGLDDDGPVIPPPDGGMGLAPDEDILGGDMLDAFVLAIDDIDVA